MKGKFRNKYRQESARLQTWNYGWEAAYFITICTKDRRFYFGNVVDGGMELSPAGIIANVLWHEIKNHTKNVEMGEFVVMPNHIHGIIILDGNGSVDPVNPINSVDPVDPVGTRHALSLPRSGQSPDHCPTEKKIGQQRFQNQGKNTISSIVGSYKSAVTKYCNRLDPDFAWQTRFHDHIIRNGKSFDRISEYIRNNPRNWKEDRFYE